MTSSSTPAQAVMDVLVDAFRQDPAFSAAPAVGQTGGLLFPTWKPRIDADDYRVYSRYANLPEIPEVKQALPRIVIDARSSAHDYEQDDVGTLHGPVTVYLHVVTEREREAYGDRIMAAGVLKVRSTPLSTARIIAAELVMTSDISREPIDAFNKAWEFIAVFRSQSVGVLL